MSSGSLASEARNACAVPWKLPWMLAGSPSWRVVASTAATASPRAAPGAKLKDRVTAGNCPWRDTTRGAVVGYARIMVSSGTATGCAARAADVDVPKASRAAAELGLDLEDHSVLVQLREHRGHLPLAEGVVERVRSEEHT